jgi:hypothetical protein
MPGDSNSYDLIRVKDGRSNSKADTFFIAPKGLGNEDFQVEEQFLEALNGDVTGNVEVTSITGDNLSIDGNGNLTAADGAPTDAEYVTLSSDPDLANEQIHANLSGAQLHDPAVHSSSHSADAADEVSVENLGTTGADGTVPTSQGNGTLAMETAGVDDSGNVLGGSASSSGDVAAHPNATANTDAGGIGIGDGANATASFNAIAIGRNADCSATDGTSVGPIASVSGEGATALGRSASASGDDSCALGRGAEATNANAGVLGVDTSTGPNSWTVPGDFTVNGSKNFEISDPARPHTHNLRHGNYEGDVAGGLIYRRSVTVNITNNADKGTASISMPPWFGPLATDVEVVVQAQGHFGDAYAERTKPNGEEIAVTANASGDYKCIIFATRDDDNVPDPEDHDVSKPKGERWNGDPRAYHRDAPDVNPSDYGVERIEQFFDHTEGCDATPCEAAFETWRVTLADGSRVDVEKPLDADIQTVVDTASA